MRWKGRWSNELGRHIDENNSWATKMGLVMGYILVNCQRMEWDRMVEMVLACWIVPFAKVCHLWLMPM